MRRLAYFVDALGFSYTFRVWLPKGWQGVSTGRCQVGTSTTRMGARWWCVRQSWRQAREDVRLDRALRGVDGG